MLKKASFLIFLLILIPSISTAEIKTITRTIKQPFSGSQSPDDARFAAIVKAKLEVLEEAGTYIESLTIVKDHKTEKYEISALSAGVLNAKIVSEEKYIEGNSFGIIVVAKVDIDTSILEDRVKSLIENKELLEKYKDSQNREETLLLKIKDLEEQNQKLSKIELKNQFIANTRKLKAITLIKKALPLLPTSIPRSKLVFKDIDKAIQYLNSAIDLDPHYPNAYLYRGLFWDIGKGDMEKAILDYSKALELDPLLKSAYLNRGSVYQRKKEYNLAVLDYNTILEIFPYFDPAYFNRANTFYAMKKWESAIDDLNVAISINPKGVYYFNRADVWYEKGNLDFALADYNKAIELNSKVEGYYINRAAVWYDNGNLDFALKDLNKAIELSPNSSYAHEKRGKIWENKDDFERAITDFNTAIELDPNNISAIGNRGFAWVMVGEYKKAISDLDVVIEKKQISARVYYYRGLSWNLLREYEKAINEFTICIEIDSSEFQPFFNRGLSYLKKSEYYVMYHNKKFFATPEIHYMSRNLLSKESISNEANDLAIDDFTKAIELNSTPYYEYLVRAFAWENKGNLDLTIKDVSKAIIVKPERAHNYMFRGKLQHNNREYFFAVKDYERAVELKADSINQYYLSWILATCPDHKYRDGLRAVGLAQKAIFNSIAVDKSRMFPGNLWKNEKARIMKDAKVEDCKSPFYLEALAAAYAEVGKFEDAIKIQAKVIELLDEFGPLKKYTEKAQLRLDTYNNHNSLTYPYPNSN